MVRLPLCCLLVVCFVTTPAQSSDQEKRSRQGPMTEFWKHFEREVEVFLARLRGEYVRADSADQTANQSAPAGLQADSGSVAATSALQVDDPETMDEWTWHTDRWARYRPVPRHERPSAVLRPPWLPDGTMQPPFIFRYNRVEGVFIGLGSTKKYHWAGDRSFSAYGSVGYGFSAHRWRGNLGVTRQFAFPSDGVDRIFEIGLEGYSLADSRDTWRLTAGENTAAALLIREDFRDYFGREGGTVRLGYASRTDNDFFEAGIGFAVDRYRSLDRRAEWALFGGGKRFRPNPAIDEGMMRSLTVSVGHTAPSAVRDAPKGWSLHGLAEFADPSLLGGEFHFQQYVADIRRYQPLGKHDQINARLRFGTSRGDLPRQKSFVLGGPATLPGYGFNAIPGDSLGGNRLLLLNLEYRLDADVLGDLSFWPSWLMRRVSLLLLMDAGIVRRAEGGSSPLEGFGGARWSEVHSNAGIGITNRSGSFRCAVVWPLDTGGPATVLVRFTRPF